jgi:4'-phosphopantetheinyl transferase
MLEFGIVFHQAKRNMCGNLCSPSQADLPNADLLQIPAGHAHVWYAWTESCSDENLAAYDSLLNDVERRRLGQFAFAALKREFLVTRALCRLTLSRYVPVPPADWGFVTNPYGRPEIDAACSTARLRFNLSNCRTLVACIVTADADAGIDVEDRTRVNDALSLADHYFAPDEVSLLKATPAHEQRRRFFELWTLKESYIKARGMGLSIPLEQFSFAITSAGVRIAFSPPLNDTAESWQFAVHELGDRHTMAVGIRKGAGPDFTITVREGLR